MYAAGRRIEYATGNAANSVMAAMMSHVSLPGRTAYATSKAALLGFTRALALELAHGYMHPIEVDRNVGLLAAVGEGMQGHPGLAGRIFTAISRAQVNVIAIAQGSSELTIAVVVRRSGLEQAVRAVHAECGLGCGAGW